MTAAATPSEAPAAPGPLVVRADGTARMGTGHVMRCLGLAEAWRAAGGAVTFAAADLGGPLADRLAADGFGVERLTAPAASPADARATAALAANSGGGEASGWVLLDGYQFGSDYKQRLGAAARVLLVDDFAEPGYEHAALVLNQTLHADPAAYPAADPARLLLGPDYTLLRGEFRPYTSRPAASESAGPVRRVLVTLGGSDPDNAAEAALEAVAAAVGEVGTDGGSVAVTAVVGALSPHADAVRAAADRLSAGGAVAVAVRDRVTDMAAVMATADLAVTAGGVTLHELAFLGVPAAIIRTAENQAANTAKAVELGFAADLGRRPGASPAALAAGLAALLADPARRAAMAAAGRRAVDGRGTDRVLAMACGGR